MEFRFDLRPIFTSQIVKINSNLLPSAFVGDRRMAIDMGNKISQIINEMGEASAKAQGLSKPVTTSHKLRLTDHIVYLLGDNDHGRHGAVVGLLKVGQKSLYVFDENGETKIVDAPCVLDFYVHESRQRSGSGKTLFETMLRGENYKVEKLAIDRPSDKLIGFLRKHYGLEKTIPQMNNFVVYDGFFGHSPSDSNNHDGRIRMTAGANTALFGPQFINDDCKKRASKSWEPHNSPTTIPIIQSSPVGRYAAPRPLCSMAEIIHSSATAVAGEANRSKITRHVHSPTGIFLPPSSRFQHVHLDIIMLPHSDNKRYCLTSIDRFSRWPEVFPLENQDAESIAAAFYSGWICRFGTPLHVTTDGGRQFESHLFRALNELTGTNHFKTTSYHPQSNGMIEPFHRQLKDAIKCYNIRSWTEILPTILLGIRASFKEDFKTTPAELLYGEPIRLPGQFLVETNDEKNNQETFVKKLKEHFHYLRPVTPKHHGTRKTFIFKNL